MSFPVCREGIFWQPLIAPESVEGALVPVLLRITHWPQERTARFTARPFSALVQQHAIFSGFFTHVYRRLILFRFGFSRLRARLSRPVIVR